MWSRARLATGLLLAVPAVAATATLAWIGAGDRLLPAGDRRLANSAEAAAFGETAELLRFLEFEDPGRVYPIRPHVISSTVRYATTLEAALWARSLDVVVLLEERGALRDAAVRRDLACLATDLDLPEIAAHLAGSDTQCRPNEGMERVTRRSAAGAGA